MDCGTVLIALKPKHLYLSVAVHVYRAKNFAEFKWTFSQIKHCLRLIKCPKGKYAFLICATVYHLMVHSILFQF